MNAIELLEMAERLRRECRFGDAINIFREAASVELIQEINGFVNVDLMNP